MNTCAAFSFLSSLCFFSLFSSSSQISDILWALAAVRWGSLWWMGKCIHRIDDDPNPHYLSFLLHVSFSSLFLLSVPFFSRLFLCLLRSHLFCLLLLPFPRRFLLMNGEKDRTWWTWCEDDGFCLLCFFLFFRGSFSFSLLSPLRSQIFFPLSPLFALRFPLMNGKMCTPRWWRWSKTFMTPLLPNIDPFA